MRLKRFYLLILFIVGLVVNINGQEGGYLNKTVVAPGEKLDFFISTSETIFDIKIIKYENKEREIQVFTGIQGKLQPVSADAYSEGAGWDKTHSITVPDSWGPGAYAAVFKTTNRESHIFFFVKERVPGNYSRIIFIVGDNTWQAYNNFGGKSLYNYNSSEKIKSSHVSFYRPLNETHTSSKFYKHERLLIKWLYENEIKIEYTNQAEVHANPDLLERYDLVLIAGHSEYWSYQERNAIERHLNRGKNMIILGGNTCWWQVRLENDNKTIVCYKEGYKDPLFGTADSIVTSNWVGSPVRNPENKVTGVSFYNGGFVNNFQTLPHSEGYGDYAAFNTHHWVYKGTGLVEGEEFGYEAAIAGNEIDGAKFKWQSGIPVVTGEDSTSKSFRILGISPAHNNNPAVTKAFGTMGIWYGRNGGIIFNSASINWVNGLEDDEHVRKITRNVFEKLITNKVAPEIIEWGPGQSSEVTINKTQHFVQSREYMVREGTSMELYFEAKDYRGHNVEYRWFVNGEKRGEGRSYTFTNDVTTSQQKKFTVTGAAYNQNDTATISWKLFNTELAISSDPKIHIEPSSHYNYKVRVFNYHNDQISYTLIKAPDWLTISAEGVISGMSPADTGDVEVEVEVANLHNIKDQQAFRLYVSNVEPLPSIPLTPSEYSLKQNYPNPFNPSTTISFIIHERSLVEVEIFNALGEKIITLINQEMEAGTHLVEWQPDVASGMYIYKLKAVSTTNPTNQFTDQKKMIFTK